MASFSDRPPPAFLRTSSPCFGQPPPPRPASSSSSRHRALPFLGLLRHHAIASFLSLLGLLATFPHSVALATAPARSSASRCSRSAAPCAAAPPSRQHLQLLRSPSAMLLLLPTSLSSPTASPALLSSFAPRLLPAHLYLSLPPALLLSLSLSLSLSLHALSALVCSFFPSTSHLARLFYFLFCSSPESVPALSPFYFLLLLLLPLPSLLTATLLSLLSPCHMPTSHHHALPLLPPSNHLHTQTQI